MITASGFKRRSQEQAEQADGGIGKEQTRPSPNATDLTFGDLTNLHWQVFANAHENTHPTDRRRYCRAQGTPENRNAARSGATVKLN